VPFAGFPSGKLHLTPIPAQFFTELLPEIDHLGELKVTLYAIWALDRMEEAVRFLTYEDFKEDMRLLKSLEPGGLDDALERCVQRGSLLKALPAGAPPTQAIYFLNSARGRAALQSIQRGEWSPSTQGHSGPTLEAERPNIFRLYEQNIGPLTPLIAEELQDAEKAYPQSWVEEAFKIAVDKNARKWNFIRAVLKSWQEEGRDATDRRNTAQDRRKYVEGEFSDFIQH
jgi:DNA replication protein